MKQNLQRLFIALLAMMMMPIGNYSLVFAQDIAEAKWGISASELPNSGTLAEAISAAEADGSSVGYIQLQKDITTEGSVIIKNGVITIDLNGKTISCSKDYTLNIREEGEESPETQVTLVDSSEGSGKVVCTYDGSSAIVVSNNAEVIIENGTYEAATAVGVRPSGSAIIKGGVFHTDSSAYHCISNSGTLLVNGGHFDAEHATSCISCGNGITTITQGTFISGTRGAFAYYGGTLDLSKYTFEANKPLTLFNFVENYELSAATISLPEGYCFYDTDFHPALHYLEYVKMYNIGKAPNKEDVEAIWGVSAESLPVYGSLSDAFRKAESNDSIKYIRLQKDVAENYIVSGGVFTLDLNGNTISCSDEYTLNIQEKEGEETQVTLTDHSIKNSGMVICTYEGSSAIVVSNNAEAIIENGIYEGARAMDVRTTGSATIKGGIFQSDSATYATIHNNGTLLMIGGRVVAGANAASCLKTGDNSTTTIKSGKLINRANSTIGYHAGLLDLSDYSTDTISNISLFNYKDNLVISDETIVLPAGFGFYDKDYQPVKDNILAALQHYTIGRVSEVEASVDEIATPMHGIQKILRNGQVCIIRDGKYYSLLGQEL